MPTLLEVKFTRADGRRETDTRVELVDASSILEYSLPAASGLARLRPGDEITEVVVSYHGQQRWQEKFDRLRMVHNTDLLNGFHSVGLEDLSENSPRMPKNV